MNKKIALLDASLNKSPVKKNFFRDIESKIDYFKISEHEFPRNKKYGGYLISGSSLSVNDKENWIKKTIEFTKELHKKMVPILGICWGHQLIAKALGGKVEKLNNRQIGYHKIKLTKKGKENKLFQNIPNPFTGFLTHRDHVTKLPPNSQTLAKKDSTIQAFRKKYSFGVQFHPEYDKDSALEVIEKYLEGERKNRIKRTVNEENISKSNKEAKKVLKNFEEKLI